MTRSATRGEVYPAQQTGGTERPSERSVPRVQSCRGEGSGGASGANQAVVWRTQSTDVWVNFKVFGIMPLTIAFTLTQMPLIQRHSLDRSAS